MSQFIGTDSVLNRKDRRLVPTYQTIRRERDRVVDRDLPTAYPGGYSNTFWPGGGGFCGDQSADVGMLQAVWRAPVARFAWGIASAVGFVGITRDAGGAPLAGVTCSLFRTLNRLFISEVVSAADGSFTLPSWYAADTHFIVFSKSGVPEVFGTTKQTLMGA